MKYKLLRTLLIILVAIGSILSTWLYSVSLSVLLTIVLVGLVTYETISTDEGR